MMKGYINVCEVEKYYGSEAGMTKAVDLSARPT